MTTQDKSANGAEPGLQFVFEVQARVSPPIELGTAQGVTRRQVPVLDGVVSGPRLQGKVLPGGADWQRIHAHGVTEILARYLIQADDGTIISVTNPGVRRAAPDVMRRLLAGELVDPSLVYFRTTPRFETAAPAHAWLMESVFVCAGMRRPDSVSLRFFAVT